MNHATLSKREFHGKLLLLGEHSVIEGSKALVMPYSSLSASLAFGEKPMKPAIFESNKVLREFASWLLENDNPDLPALHIREFIRDIEQGLYCRSDIPPGYGLGSSGAVCASVYYEYGAGLDNLSGKTDQENLFAAKKALAAMESYFHGKSSGIDPLCIFYNKPLVIEGMEKIQTWQIDRAGFQTVHCFLLDTGLTGNTRNLVNSFRDKLKEQQLRESYTGQYVPLVNGVVDQFAGGFPDYDSLVQLSLFQWRIFQDMIPPAFQSAWQYGLDWEYYVCKLCGSGGGGYILGFTKDFDYARRCLRDRFDLEPIYLEIG